MSRINIRERDLTTSTFDISENTDIVYVPGFSLKTVSDAAIGGDTSLGGMPAGYPVICEDLTTFVAYFGDTTPYFASAQAYPIAGYPTEASVGFAQDAVPGFSALLSEFQGDDEPTIPTMYAQYSPDPGYIYAKELISRGIAVMYERINYDTGKIGKPFVEVTGTPASTDLVAQADCEVTIANFYKATYRIFNSDKLKDKGEYQFKFLTTGGYPIYEYNGSATANKMLALCENRGDCVALVDHTDNPDRALDKSNTHSVYYSVNNSDFASSFGAMYTPWYKSTTVNSFNVIEGTTTRYAYPGYFYMPGSFAYLASYAKSIQTNANWLAVAGTSRGVVPRLISPHLNTVLTNSIAESYQPEGVTAGNSIAINPITNIKPYGQTIWGNRTLKDNQDAQGTVATSFINIRNLVSDIKKQVYVAAKSLMFEQNNDILWVNFKSLVTPMLDQMVSGYGISGYKMIKNTVLDNDGATLAHTKLSAIVRIYPVYAVESFDIMIELSDEEVSVESEE